MSSFESVCPYMGVCITLSKERDGCWLFSTLSVDSSHAYLTVLHPHKKEFVCVTLRVEIMLCVSFSLSLLPTYLYHIGACIFSIVTYFTMADDKCHPLYF